MNSTSVGADHNMISGLHLRTDTRVLCTVHATGRNAITPSGFSLVNHILAYSIFINSSSNNSNSILLRRQAILLIRHRLSILTQDHLLALDYRILLLPCRFLLSITIMDILHHYRRIMVG